MGLIVSYPARFSYARIHQVSHTSESRENGGCTGTRVATTADFQSFVLQIDLKHSYIAIASVIMGVSLMNAPNFLTYKIVEMGLNETCIITDESVRDASAYVPGVSDVATQADCLVSAVCCEEDDITGVCT